MDYWGIKDNKQGLSQLGNIFSAGLNGKVAEGGTKVDQYGTSVLREVPLLFTKGEKKGQSAGVMQISYFYKNSDMSSTPEITSIRAIPDSGRGN